ncbi:MAG: ABC transporter ATP-binding protein/permease, partial [Lachnospiraceae bacterium]|nr:ABC transporter ATP-binding protein/permease [Lachnospiraceae bacterium]
MGQKKQKEAKRKPKYGLFSCVGYIYRLLWHNERGLVFTGIFTVPLSLALSALALYTPSAVLSVLEASDRFTPIALVIVGLLFAELLCDLANNILSAKINNAEHCVMSQMRYIWEKYERDRDWYLAYDPEVQKLDERARNATMDNHRAGAHFPMDFSNILTQILSFLLFGAVVSMLHPVIILLLAVGCAINAAMGKWERKKNWEERDVRNDLDRKIECVTWTISQDFRYAKDIRLYGMKQFLHDRIAWLHDLKTVELRKMGHRSILTAFVNFLIVVIRDGAAYVFLISEAVRGNVDASSFVLYLSEITYLSWLMNGILGKINWILEGAMQVSDFREAMEVEGRLNQGPGIPVPRGPFSIEFKHVSYQYPKGEKKVLDNISFRIKAGEKIALVGVNGAGKTTLTMLMCGMLLPDEGEILLDGHTLYEYNRDEMYGLFGVVPQNYNLLPMSLAQNIASAASEEEIDRDRIAACIELAGLTEKIAALHMGADTLLGRELYEDGVELSGGEKQKLLLARLLYKNPPCIILDEPTAALDPIAEDRMYRNYHQIAAQATSIFISHRLASTNFCDRIFLLDGARFAEVGTHEELMAAGGKYRELFEVQSKYYKEAKKDG